MKGWDTGALLRLENKGLKISDSKKLIAPDSGQLKSVPKEEPKPLKEMKQILRFMHIDFKTEYKVLQGRKFRFDIAIPDSKVAIEYEGLLSNKSRHTTLTGYSRDTLKYNLAVIAGWKVLRYTQLTYKQFLSDLNKII